jgi:hypothetical protein
VTVKITITLTALRFKLDPVTAGRTYLIKRGSTTRPGLNFPRIRITETVVTERVAIPAPMLTLRDSATTTTTSDIKLTKAIFAKTLLFHANEAVSTIINRATTITLKPVRVPTRMTVFGGIITRGGMQAGIRLAVDCALHQTTTMRATGKKPIIAIKATINTIRPLTQLVTLTIIIETEQTVTLVASGVKIIQATLAH